MEVKNVIGGSSFGKTPAIMRSLLEFGQPHSMGDGKGQIVVLAWYKAIVASLKAKPGN